EGAGVPAATALAKPGMPGGFGGGAPAPTTPPASVIDSAEDALGSKLVAEGLEARLGVAGGFDSYALGLDEKAKKDRRAGLGFGRPEGQRGGRWAEEA